MDALKSELKAALSRHQTAELRLRQATSTKEEATRIAEATENDSAVAVRCEQQSVDKKRDHHDRAAAISSFPTETQLLKLERRLGTLKSQLSDVEASIAETSTLINAYDVRCQAQSSSRREIGSALDEALKAISEGTDAQTSQDAAIAGLKPTLDAIEALVEISDDREGALVDLNQRYSSRLEEEMTLNDRIVAQQQRTEAEIPRIHSEADRCLSNLTAAWTAEKEALQMVYDKLYSVNKEQQHHLARGTHVKRDALTNEAHEAALSARHGKLSAELIDARARLEELQIENDFVKKITKQLRAEGRATIDRYDQQKTEVAARLEAARDERKLAEDEARKFRSQKGQLQQALQSIRDTPSAAQSA